MNQSPIKTNYLIVVALFIFSIHSIAQNSENYILTKSGEKVSIHPDLEITSYKNHVYFGSPEDDIHVGPSSHRKSKKIKKVEVEKIVVRDEVHIPLDTNSKKPYIFRIVAKNENYTLGITTRWKSSGDSMSKNYFLRDYFAIYDTKKGKEIIFDKLNRDKKKSIKIIKKYFNDCLDDKFPTDKKILRSYKHKHNILQNTNQLECN
ncbi:hypothetical protein [Aquimarina mytili]|uniref:Uncharacterized protein n=1 Tax=Aquimarina mytili TaxID=874423 RepID=A0A937D8I5_9FLAO|nr:hypothetical protein [Aquimarina mytili]MBL0684100.1 hypothetical protein [Aquimarina mytili]